MTALIKSTDGSGWVEARLNDRVKFTSVEYPEIEPIVFTVSEFVEEKDLDFSHWLSDGHDWYSPKLCQLVERPFQVDDAAQVLYWNGWADHTIIAEDLKVPGINSDPTIRHSSPLLRPVGDV